MAGLRITVKAADLQKEVTLSHQKAQRLTKELWAKLRSVSFDLERRIKEEMPVDTGRARASWGRWRPGSLRKITLTTSSGEKERHSKGSVYGNEASHTDAYWVENMTELKIEQGSNVDYIEKLNAGHSRQAPAGFIDAAEKDAERILINEVNAVIARYV